MDEVKDIVPELLESIKSDYRNGIKTNEKIKDLIITLNNAKVNYSDANNYSQEIGQALVDAYAKNITVDSLPDGKMYFNIADRTLNPTMKEAYEDISNYAVDVQSELNEMAGINIKGIAPELNQDRIDGIVNKISESDNFEDVAWLLDEPIKNFCQSIVDDTVKKNIEFHHSLGLSPKITRKEAGNCCDWCKSVVGTYKYPHEVPEDIYKRHRYCRCEVSYDPGDGSKKKQDIWSKKWKEQEESAKIEARKILSIPNETITISKLDKLKNSGLKQDDYEEYTMLLNSNNNKGIKKLYRDYADNIAFVNLGDRAHYSPANNSLTIHIENSKDMHKYSTIAHEYGHFFDSKTSSIFKHEELGKLKEIVPEAILPKRKVSSSDEFLSAVRKDKESLTKIGFEKLKADLYGKNASAGVQDAIDGMFIGSNKRISWGHGESYYNRDFNKIKDYEKIFHEDYQTKIKDAYIEMGHKIKFKKDVQSLIRDYETSSEMFANILSAETTQGEELDFIKNYLPNSYQVVLEYLKGVK